MMKSFGFFIFFSGLLISNLESSIASDSFSAYTHTNTLTSALELKPASLLDSYKTAAVCFIGYGDCDPNVDFGKGDDYSRNPEQMCHEDGFIKTFCSIPEYLYNACPYDKRFYKECRRDNAKACIDSGYSLTCGLGYVPNYSQTCPYDASYKKCKCDPCEGFVYTQTEAIAEGYVSEGSCQNCSVTKYKRKENLCEGYRNCECGGEIGANVCYSGTVKKFANCKACYVPVMNGNILYSDMTTSPDIVIGKTPIGVVFNSENRLAVALNQSNYLAPGGYNTHVTGLTKCGATGSMGNYDSSNVLSCDTNGKDNTAAIITFANTSGKSFPAAEFCYNYTTSGTTKGDWFLPSIKELKQLITNKMTIDATLSKLGKNSLYNATDSNWGSCGYWSSNEADEYAQWYYTETISWSKKYDSDTGGNSYSVCGNGYYIARPVIKF